MQVFELHRPDFRTVTVEYAEAGGRGPWGKVFICPVCNSREQERLEPLVIEWEPGSDIIPDFSWPFGSGDLVVTQRVRDSLEPKFKNLIFRPVEMIQDKKLKKPKRKSRKPRVWLLYEGPNMYEMKVETHLHIDKKASGIPDYPKCDTCERVLVNKPMNLSRLVLRKTEWTGEHIFHFHESRSPFYCTWDFIKEIEENKFTNVEWKEVGRIF